VQRDRGLRLLRHYRVLIVGRDSRVMEVVSSDFSIHRAAFPVVVAVGLGFMLIAIVDIVFPRFARVNIELYLRFLRRHDKNTRADLIRSRSMRLINIVPAARSSEGKKIRYRLRRSEISTSRGHPRPSPRDSMFLLFRYVGQLTLGWRCL